MSFSQSDQMFRFISHYKYEISINVPDSLQCGKCKSILINAYCVPCGCSYCYECVNEMLINGVENCPGKYEDCKDVLISNNQVDFRTNKEISKLVIKCPEEMCSYECAIINMEEHVRVCEKNSVKCPFANLGCNENKIAREMMNDHCQSASFNHCKILIEMIDNMRNEIDILKVNVERNRLEIKKLKKNLKSKDEIIDKINCERNLIKIENENIKQEFESFKISIDKEMEIKNNFEKENKLKNMEKCGHSREYGNIKKDFERKTNKIFSEIEQFKSINDETNSLKYPKFEWTTDKLDEWRKKGGWIESEYFTGMIKQYKFRLSFWANGSREIKGKGCSIYLRIYPGENDQFLCWPFSADVTIKMMSKTNPHINKSITKYCKIDKANYAYNHSDGFDYLYCDLTKDGEKLDNCFIVECFVDFK